MDPDRGGSSVATQVTALSPCSHVSAVGYNTYSWTVSSPSWLRVHSWLAAAALVGVCINGCLARKVASRHLQHREDLTRVGFGAVDGLYGEHSGVGPGISERQSPISTSVAVTVP